MATRDNLLFKIQINENPELSDDKIVEDCMNKLIEKYPTVKSYQYHRQDKDTILILMWFSEPIEVSE